MKFLTPDYALPIFNAKQQVIALSSEAIPPYHMLNRAFMIKQIKSTAIIFVVLCPFLIFYQPTRHPITDPHLRLMAGLTLAALFFIMFLLNLCRYSQLGRLLEIGTKHRATLMSIAPENFGIAKATMVSFKTNSASQRIIKFPLKAPADFSLLTVGKLYDVYELLNFSRRKSDSTYLAVIDHNQLIAFNDASVLLD